jgi:hypothetical protein
MNSGYPWVIDLGVTGLAATNDKRLAFFDLETATTIGSADNNKEWHGSRLHWLKKQGVC